MAVLVRKATVDDYAAARELYRGFASIDPAAGDPAPGEFEQWRALLDHPGTSVILAERDDEVVCMATLHVLPNMTRSGRPYALIENVITAANHRHRGIGRRVMAETVNTAWQAGAYKIMLLTDSDRSDGGVREFYEKIGLSADRKFGMTLFARQ